MILDISERKVDNAALVVSHQLVEALNQIFLGGLVFLRIGTQCIAYQAERQTYTSRAPRPHESFGLDGGHVEA